VCSSDLNGQIIRFTLVALGGIALLAYALCYLHRLLELSDQQAAAAELNREQGKVNGER
jgi:hypothetical protein